MNVYSVAFSECLSQKQVHTCFTSAISLLQWNISQFVRRFFFLFRRHFLHWYFNFNKITHTKNIIHWKKSLSGMTVQVMNEICEATCCDWNKALCLFVVGSWKQACNIVLLNVFYHTKSLFSKEPRYSCHYSLCRSLGHSDLACVFKKIYYIENLLCWH